MHDVADMPNTEMVESKWLPVPYLYSSCISQIIWSSRFINFLIAPRWFKQLHNYVDFWFQKYIKLLL